MYPNKLLHLDGMLDRDQRTIITITQKRSREKFEFNLNNNGIIINNNKNNNNQINKLNSVQNNYFIFNSINNNFNNNNNSKKNNKMLVKKFNCDKMKINKNYVNDEISPSSSSSSTSTVLSKYSDNLFSVKNDYNMHSKLNNYNNLSNNNRMRKLSLFNFNFKKLNSFIVYIFLWLFILQRARASPLRMADDENNHHHTNNNNNNNHHHHQHHQHHHHNKQSNENENNLECSDVRDVIDKILRQANVSYEINYAKLDNFTQTLFKEHHQDYHNEWRHKHFDWLYPNKKQLKLDDYDKQVPEEALSHLKVSGVPDKKELSRELTDLYVRLKILAMAIENIRADHDLNIYELMSRYPNDKHIHIVDYFKEQDRYIRALLIETGSAMKKLGVPQPNYIADNGGLQSYQGVRDLRDWIVTREHLKLLHYVLKAYEILLTRCS